jgi:diguanylate cyclase (GGDEF)-like protein
MLINLELYAGTVAALLQASGVPLDGYRTFQTSLIVFLVFLITGWNFGFLLMAIDRLRAEVTELAMHDDLTGVANRRQLFGRLSSECMRSARSLVPFTLLAIDLDGFKAVNDNFGHAAGDHCLRVIADKMNERLRKTDLLARVGGDEFFVLMPATNLEEGGRVAQDLLDICQSHEVSWTGKPIRLAASIGVAQWSPAPHLTPEHLMVAADQALYAAKERGKGCYTMAPIALPVRKRA